MKAIVRETYGSPDVLELRDVDTPTVGDDDVLVRVRAAAVNPADWHYLVGTPYLVRVVAGLRKPKQPILGLDMAGDVERVGANITEFQPGDQVYGENSAAFAEYVSVPERRIVKKPANITIEQAAAVPIAALTALQGLRDKGQIKSGDKVLINGASGGVGTFAVQIAKALGGEVTGVCSTRNVEMVKSIGADHVIDYTEENFTTAGGSYDLILDTVGNHSLSKFKHAMKPNGRYISVGGPTGSWIGPLTHMIKIALASVFGRQTMRTMLAKQTPEDLVALNDLLGSGAVTPVIDRTYDLEEAADAMRYQGDGHTQGKSILKI